MTPPVAQCNSVSYYSDMNYMTDDEFLARFETHALD